MTKSRTTFPTNASQNNLLSAIRKVDANQVEELLKSDKAFSVCDFNQALCSAIKAGNKRIVLLLLNDLRSDPAHDDCLPVKNALEQNKLEIAHLLVRYGGLISIAPKDTLFSDFLHDMDVAGMPVIGWSQKELARRQVSNADQAIYDWEKMAVTTAGYIAQTHPDQEAFLRVIRFHLQLTEGKAYTDKEAQLLQQTVDSLPKYKAIGEAARSAITMRAVSKEPFSDLPLPIREVIFTGGPDVLLSPAERKAIWEYVVSPSTEKSWNELIKKVIDVPEIPSFSKNINEL